MRLESENLRDVSRGMLGRKKPEEKHGVFNSLNGVPISVEQVGDFEKVKIGDKVFYVGANEGTRILDELVRRVLESGQNTSEAEELFKIAQDIRGESAGESEEIRQIEQRRDELIRNLEKRIPEAREKGQIHVDEILASIDRIWIETDERIRALEKKA